MIKIFKKLSKKILTFVNKRWRGINLSFLKYIFYLFLAGCALILFLFFYYTYDLPRPEKFTESPFIQSTKIYDRTGKILLYDVYNNENREIIAFDKISDNLKHAVLASEDARFYEHGGIDFEGIVRSILINLKLQSASQGASTITQQLIRSVYLTNQKTIGRKIREIVLSLEIEKRYSKDQIFEWYLNQIPLGGNIYGVETASQAYFKKSSSDLSLAESAALTAMIKAPGYYSPYGPNKNKLLLEKDYVLKRMEKLRYITKDQLEKAEQEKIVFSENTIPIKAPHFVMYIKKYLEDKYGEDFLKEKGLKIYTTLDWDLQNYAEQVVEEADKTNRTFNANNTALVVIDPKTGEILSLIGSKNYFEKSYPEGCEETPQGLCLFSPQFDVATMGYRQPGSSFKPFVYATAFKKGYTPDTVLWDVKTEFNPYCSPDANQLKDAYGLACYHPQNYDETYRGKVTIRQSLAGSLNLPSVKTLYLAGLNDSIQTAKDFGITTLNEPDRYGLSLVLGGGEVTLLEMTSAYGVFATEGVRSPIVSILKIEDSDGKIIEENKKQPTKVLDTQVARQINNILSDNSARAPIFGVNNALYFNGYQVAAKTGTTQYFNDAWTMGYTPFASVGVWVGNNDNSSTDKKTGIGLAAPIWRKIMQKLLESRPVENFNSPNLITNINPILLGQIDPADTHSILYYINKKDPLGPPPQNPTDDIEYLFWETGIKNWLTNKY
ncbi:MAG: transglycosylase domain-containing protein [Candidatus Staskawiczbacteria bacterium]|nr:transglycosylase domain-containing protein [Candidatus Staskawiczbacteria bacterium]